MILCFIVFLFPLSADAQRRKAVKRPVKKPKKVEQVVEEDPRIRQMLDATQQVVFVDSMVVAKDDFISHIPLSKECGRLVQKNGLGQYTNELGDQRLSTVFNAADSASHIVMSEFLANRWTEPKTAKGIGDASANYPYVMPDGITLYYAQKGPNSIGGYDIFTTRYNADNGSFLRPENLGMPFSSEANDYLYVIDEPQQLGYFVTDRRQPAGKVCIYVFIPSTTRRVYTPEAYSDEQLRSLAAINRIADTWKGNSEARSQALQRFKEAKALLNAESKDRQLSELDKMRQEATVMEKTLEASRKVYAEASDDRRSMMRQVILRSEQELETLQRQIKQREKEERNKNAQIK